MVYGGKPSLGCQCCKDRRIKCDEGRPTCHQCMKSSRICPGYRDEVDLIFRNQTDLVTSKAKRPKRRNSPRANVPKVASKINKINETSPMIVRYRKYPPTGLKTQGTISVEGITYHILPNPQASIEDQAVAVYLKNVVLQPQSQETLRGFLEYLAPLYNASYTGSPLRLATSAVAMAAMGKRSARARSLLPLSAAAYGDALKSLNNAIHGIKECQTDETIQAILMLCLYESMTAMEKSHRAWSSHVDGATAIVMSRGPYQLDNPQSLALFRAVRTQMVTNCIQRQECPPTSRIKGGWLADVHKPGNPAYSLARASLPLPGLLERRKILLAMRPSPKVFEAVNRLIEQAFELESELKNWQDGKPDDRRPRTVAYVQGIPDDLKQAEAWVGPIQVYRDVHVSSILNKAGSCRYLTAALIIDCFEWLDPQNYMSDERCASVMYVELQSIDEICHSLPFHLGWDLDRKRANLNRYVTESMGAYGLLWPLSAIVNCPRLSTDQRTWLTGRMNAMADNYGLEQARVIQDDKTLAFMVT